MSPLSLPLTNSISRHTKYYLQLFLHVSTACLAFVKPILTQTLSSSPELSYIFILHLLIAFLSMPWYSLSTFSCIFSFHFVLQLQASMPNANCHLFFVPLFLYNVALACLCLCRFMYHASSTCTFIAHFVLHLPNTVWLVLHLQIVHSNLVTTYKLSIFYCSFLKLWILYLFICLAPQILCQPIIYLAACHVPWYVLYAMHLCLALLFNPMCWEFFLASLSDPMSCTFDFHLWLAPLNPMPSLACCLAFCLHFLCTVSLYLCLAISFLLSCAYSYYV